MGCQPFSASGGVTGIICSRGRQPVQRCSAPACAAKAAFLCDAPVGTGTCDAPICTRHAREGGEDRHHCPQHPVAPPARSEAEQQAIYAAWLATRPEKVRAVAARFRPWRPHRFKATGEPCTLRRFTENQDSGQVLLRVEVQQALGIVHDVYGVHPDDIEEIPDGTV